MDLTIVLVAVLLLAFLLGLGVGGLYALGLAWAGRRERAAALRRVRALEREVAELKKARIEEIPRIPDRHHLWFTAAFTPRVAIRRRWAPCCMSLAARVAWRAAIISVLLRPRSSAMSCAPR